MIEKPIDAESRTASLIGSREVILVVDDDSAVRELARRLLTRHGYHAVVAATAGEGLAMIDQLNHRIDLVLTDVIMPEMSGKELATILKARRPHLPIVFMSGHSKNLPAEHGQLESAVELVEKPFRSSDLLRKIRQQLDASRSL